MQAHRPPNRFSPSTSAASSGNCSRADAGQEELTAYLITLVHAKNANYGDELCRAHRTSAAGAGQVLQFAVALPR